MEAMKLNKQYISVTLALSMIPEINNGKNKIGNIFQALLNSFYFNVGPWGKIKKRYRLKNINRYSELLSPDLNLLPVSDNLWPREVNWEKNHIVAGTW
jgi:hypothetical protein